MADSGAPDPLDPAGAGVPAGGPTDGATDARAWVTLAVVMLAALIVVLDNTILNVAIPTILREFDTDLPTLQWVITGYSLTFATLLVIGGRLGDLYGPRRVFMVGAALFGLGSLLASESWSVGSLVLGEAVIEGIGASLMMPATLALLSTTFSGAKRATAFAAWGSIVGSAAALGPLLGGWLTTDFSWRWSFRINVIVAPIAILGAWLFFTRDRPANRREQLDAPGAACIAVGMFLLVFGLSEGGTYGWWRPLRSFTLGGVTVWPEGAAVSMIPVVFVLTVAVLLAFVRIEAWRERTGRSALFEFRLLRYRTFRYGLVTTTITAIGQFGMMFAVALFLQDGKHLSALRNGLWMLPVGVSIVAAAPIAGRLVTRHGGARVVRGGLIVQAIGLGYLASRMRLSASFWELFPGLAGHGFGTGLASSQLTSIILSEIPHAKSGVAGGTNTTARQVGSALGIAVMGAVVTAGATVIAGSRAALWFATAVVLVGAVTAFLIPVRLPTDPAGAGAGGLDDDLDEEVASLLGELG